MTEAEQDKILAHITLVREAMQELDNTLVNMVVETGKIDDNVLQVAYNKFRAITSCTCRGDD